MSFPAEYQLDHRNLDGFPLMIGRGSKEGITSQIMDMHF